jgi:hypothetical protein
MRLPLAHREGLAKGQGLPFHPSIAATASACLPSRQARLSGRIDNAAPSSELPDSFQSEGEKVCQTGSEPRWVAYSLENCRQFRMTIVIKVSDEQILRLIRQLGEEFSLQAEGWLGTPDGEGKE